MNHQDSKLEIRKDQARGRLRAIGGEYKQLRESLEALETTRNGEILAARDLGLTLQEIADLLELTKGRVSQIEKGIR